MSTVDQLLREGARRLGGLGGSPRLDAELLLAHALGQSREDLYRSLFSGVPPEAEERYGLLLARAGDATPRRPAGGPAGLLDVYPRGHRRHAGPAPGDGTAGGAGPGPDSRRMPPGRSRIWAPARAPSLWPSPGSVPPARCWPPTSASRRSPWPGAMRRRWVCKTSTSSRATGSSRCPSRTHRSGVATCWFRTRPTSLRTNGRLTDPELGFEPRLALDGGRDGLDAYRVLTAGAPRYLRPGGWLLLEHGFRQGEEVRALLKARRLRQRDHDGRPGGATPGLGRADRVAAVTGSA